MAVVAATVKAVGVGNEACLLATWAAIGDSDTCTPVSFPDFPDRSVHAWGTFSSASIAVQGSNNGGTSFASLRDPTSTTIALTSEGIKAVLENTQQIKPVTSGGSGSSVSVAILFHLSQALRA